MKESTESTVIQVLVQRDRTYAFTCPGWREAELLTPATLRLLSAGSQESQLLDSLSDGGAWHVLPLVILSPAASF